MKTIRRLIHAEVLQAVGFVALGFLALFLFFDLVDELPQVGRGGSGYRIAQALGYVLLLVPSHLYEVLPIATLIGTVFVMARLAQSSEFTILRTSGLSPARALWTLLQVGMLLSASTFLIGDYVVPQANRAAQLLKASYLGLITVGQTGAWLKEHQDGLSYSVNVRALDGDGSMQGVRVFAFDATGRLQLQIQAPRARFAPEGWVMEDVTRTYFTRDDRGPRVARATDPSWTWQTGLTAEMVSAALLNPERMKAWDLFVYQQHLRANGQSALKYEIAFWRKVFYPLSCLVMVVLALPFAYLHFRSGSITSYVFGGVMAGISFFLLNNLFGYLGTVQSWSPWLAAAAPSLVYSMLSLGAFGWLVLRR